MLLAVAVTDVDRSGASVLLSTAVMVTRSVLVVSPASIVIVFAVDGTVYTPDLGVTVTVVAALEVLFSDADTMLVPPFSAIEVALSASDTVAAVSSLSVFVPRTSTLGTRLW